MELSEIPLNLYMYFFYLKFDDKKIYLFLNLYGNLDKTLNFHNSLTFLNLVCIKNQKLHQKFLIFKFCNEF